MVIRRRRDTHSVAPLRVFISYRREDTAGHAGRLYDSLRQRFPADHLFMDIDTIPAGADFVEVVERAVRECDVMLLLIGQQWTTVAANGERRLDNPSDFVRLEAEAALNAGLRLIPVLVQAASMPTSAQLPEPLRPLTRRNAVRISDTRWRYDVDQLLEDLERVAREKAGEARAQENAHIPPRRGGSIGRTRRRGALAAVLAAALAGAVTLGVVMLNVASPRSDLQGSRSASTAISEPSGAAVSTPTPPPATMSPAATGSPTIFAGSGSEVTEPFVVDASWMLRWESSSWMSAFVIRDESDSHVAWFPGVDEGGQGESPVYAGGTFVLDVSALQDTTWTLTVEDLEEWPKAQLPLSVAGTAAVNTAGFESSEDLQICWQYEGTSNFIVDLVGLGPSQREDNQSIVNSLGHSSDCARLSPGWPQSYLEIVATGGEWQITIAVAGSP